MDTFLQEWFENENWWFHASKNDDMYLYDKFVDLLDNKNNYILTDVDNIKQKIGKIIILDQLPRHFLRNQLSSHVINWYLEHALKLSIEIIENNDNIVDTLEIKYLSFLLLPMRHSQIPKWILKCIQIIWEKLQKLQKIHQSHLLKTNRNEMENDILFLKKILRATYTKIDQYHFTSYFVNENVEKCSSIEFQDILDCKGPLYTDFIKNRSTNFTPHPSFMDLSLPYHTRYIVSLSGGVDSMLCAFSLKKMGFHVYAAFINYDNREKESEREEDFLKCWCRDLNIPIYIRTIFEIHREQCMQYGLRDVYEKYTKKVRFSLYHFVKNKILLEEKITDNDIFVVLGHNADDCFENILTNIVHRDKFQNMKGMEYFMNQDNINFVRPLINVSKKEIYNLAKAYSLPYLKDSTPTWSQRGKIRDKVRPVLLDFDENIVDSMSYLSDVMQESQIIVNHYALSIFENLVLEDNCFVWNFTNFSSIPTSKMIWKTLLQKMSGKFPSHKSLECFLNKVEIIKKDGNKCSIKQCFMLQKNLSISLILTQGKGKMSFILDKINQ